MALIAASDIRAELRLGTGETGDDTQIGIIAGEVCALVDQWLGRTLASATYTHALDGSGTPFLRLRQYPVTSITSVKINSSWRWSLTTALDSDTYQIDTEAIGIERADGCWERGRGNIQVVYVAGYTTYPADLVGLARRLGAKRYRAFTEKRQDVQNRTGIDGTSESWGALLDDNDRAILDRHRRLGL